MAPSRRHLIFLLPLLLLLMGTRLAPLTDPEPIAVPQGMPLDTVEHAIAIALEGWGWVITGQAEGRVDARLHVRAHLAEIRIEYDARQVALSYVSSENLDYEEQDGQRFILRNYTRWIDNLLAGLSSELALAAAD